MVRSVWVDHVFSSSSFSLPISTRMSVSSFSGSPLWVFTLISRVAVPAFTRFCSLMTSPSGDRVRLSFAPPPIHLFMTRRVVSLSVRYNRFSLSCLGGSLYNPGALLVLGGSSSCPLPLDLPCGSVVPPVLYSEEKLGADQ